MRSPTRMQEMMISDKGIIGTFYLEQYPITIIGAIGDVYDELAAKYERPDGRKIESPDEEYPAFTMDLIEKESNDACILIWFHSLDECKEHYICHECAHAALNTYKVIGAYADVDNQEPYCYLIGYIYRKMAIVRDRYARHLNKDEDGGNTETDSITE